jgi:hypothetical protein
MSPAELSELHAVQRHRPLVRGDDRDTAVKRLLEMGAAGLSAHGRTGAHLRQDVGLGRAHPLERRSPVANAGQFANRTTVGGRGERRRQVDPAVAVNEAVSPIGESDDLEANAIALLELRGAVDQDAAEPLSHRPEPDNPDPKRVS